LWRSCCSIFSVIKDETPGDIYIYPVECDKSGIDYNYYVVVDMDNKSINIYIYEWNTEEPLFIGTPNEVLDFISKEGEE